MLDPHILVVDNSPVIRKIVSHVLEEAGYFVQTAEDGLAALDCIAATKPDIIFTDLIMPKIDGAKLSLIVRNRPDLKDIFIVVLSGVAIEDDINTADLEANVCIAKGSAAAMKKHILAAMDKYLSGYRGRTMTIEGMEGLFPREVTSELLVSKQHREVILARMTEGVIELDHKGRIVMVNSAGAALFNIREALILGRRIVDLLPEPVHMEVDSWINRLDPTVSVSPLVYDYDEVVWFGSKQVTLNLVPVREEQQVFIIVIMQDVSRRKEMEVRQHQLEKELQRIHKIDAMTVMANGIAHDFNNLLTVVSGNVEMARMVSTNEQVADLLTESNKALDLITDLIRQFTTFSDNYLPQKSQVELVALIDEVLRGELDSADIRYQIIGGEEQLSVGLDPNLVRQLFTNICKNSVEAINDKGEITVIIDTVDGKSEGVATGQPLSMGDYIRVIFKDSGAGIEDHIIEKIFDPYFSTKQKGTQKGMGLGLTIVHSIMKKHGGRVWIDSQPGKGCAVFLYFPLANDLITAEKTVRKGNAVKRVIVMDDEEMMRVINKKMFEYCSCEVALATNGEEAVALYGQGLLQNNIFDLVLLDLRIENGMGGLEASRQILEIDPTANLIAMSGDVGDDVMQHYARHNFIAALAKPFSIDVVKDVVQRFINT